MRALRSVSVALSMLLIPIGVGLAACASAPDDEFATSQAQLRLLRAGEVLGALLYGESRSVDYASTPRYRAFRFSGNQGDSVEAWVRSPDGDALAFVLGADYKTLASNDDASSSTRDARVEVTLPSTGTYYLAFRDVDFEPSRMTATLTRLAGSGSSTDGGTASDASDARDASDASDASDARDAGVQQSITQFSQVLAETVCRRAAGCCSSADRSYVLSSYIQTPVDPSECVTKVASVLIARHQKWAGSMTRGTVRFDANGARQCLFGIQFASCGERLLTAMFDESACSTKVFVKQAKLGDSCQDIADGTFSGECDAALGFCGAQRTCEAWAKTGEQCSVVGQRKFCAPGLACEGASVRSGKCSAPFLIRKIGESCVNALCETGAYCDNVGGVFSTQKCVSTKAAGASCTMDVECREATPFSCNPVTSRCGTSFCAAP